MAEKLHANEVEPEEEEEEEVEVVDPADALRKAAEPACQKYVKELEACTERVSSRSKTEETCEQELYDFLHCRDCKVAKDLFSQLK